MNKLDTIAVGAVVAIQAASIPSLIGVIDGTANIPAATPALFLIGLVILTVHSFITHASYVYKLANTCGVALNGSILWAIFVL